MYFKSVFWTFGSLKNAFCIDIAASDMIEFLQYLKGSAYRARICYETLRLYKLG